MQIDFGGRTVLVTGAAHGLGRAMAGAFAARGATVYVCDVAEEELAKTVDIVGERCHGMLVDVTDRRAVGQWVDSAASMTGRVDVLVNNAGGVLGQVGRPLEEVATEEWQAIVAVNQTASFWTTQAVAPHMKRARYGRVVNISSGAGLGVSLTGIQAYASAKAGQIGLTRQLAHELGPFGITVNNIAPGFVRSNVNTEKQWDSYGPEGQEDLISRIALRRLGTPADIAHAVLFFASEYAGWITGAVLPVDGGR
ncbi:MAG TPA: SDR family oxidoreductase [Gemmatimonadetes bacterium]|nr:SDR family oxidoreductase [Gemmatimonadota bacterium]